MVDPLVLLAVFLAFLVSHFLKLLAKRLLNKKLNLPPSPPKLPIIGNLHQLGKYPYRAMQALSKKYGPLMYIYYGKTPSLVVSSAEVAQEILRTHDVAFASRPQSMVIDTLTNGRRDVLFSPYGEYWRQVRKVSVVELLSQRRVQEFRFVREEFVAKMLENVRQHSSHNRAGRGAAIDLSDMFLTLAESTISKCTIGGIYETEIDGEKVSVAELSRRVTSLNASLFFSDIFPLFGWIDSLTGLAKRLTSTAKGLSDLLDPVFGQHNKQLSDSGKSTSEERLNFLGILLSLKETMPDINLSREDCEGILIDMFTGGIETTASSMEWAMAELAKNPSAMKKVQEEVREIVGDKQAITDDDVSKMVYLKCVFKETLRLHSPPLFLRATSTDVKVRGYDIPANTRVVVNSWAIQRDPEVWERPDEFIPDRFLGTSVDFRGQHHQLVPFGGGRRICPGISFAVAEVENVLANLLHWYDWELPNGTGVEDLDMMELGPVGFHRRSHIKLIPVMRSP